MNQNQAMTTSAEIRQKLINALRLDLVRPVQDLGMPEEVLDQAPSRWYLTGFLVPTEADESQKSDADGDDELEEGGDTKGTDDANEPEKPAARRAYMPSSVGVSLLVAKDASKIDVLVRWGDYFFQERDPDEPKYYWKRSPREETVLDAFRIANRAMNVQAARRLDIPDPKWRPFQLAFLLMNLKGIVEPTDDDRAVVDLLFFPTGGGKTEAYLGLATFTLVLRRLRNPGISSAGLTVLMRYTLRLLTLDQLGRASALICALELERQKDAEKLGDWPFEIALWVGKAAGGTEACGKPVFPTKADPDYQAILNTFAPIRKTLDVNPRMDMAQAKEVVPE